MAESTGTAPTTERIVKSEPSDLSEGATSSRSIFARYFTEHLMLRASSITSILALTFSGYSLWESSLKHSDLKVFVAPVVRYASPYQNSNFEVFAVPLTISNEGARTGTIMSLGLEVSDGKRSKRFSALISGSGASRRRVPATSVRSCRSRCRAAAATPRSSCSRRARTRR